MKPYEMEVVGVLKSMHPGKLPGPDGFSAMFYHKFWDIVGPDVCRLVLWFLNNGGMASGLNNTHVVLIPEIKKPKPMKDLHPISLCNISYKFISKVMANRLTCFLPDIIDDSQSAFVPGRLITDNVLLASEVFHFMKTSLARKRGFMALKLDISKAYDRVEWDYLQRIIVALGFPDLWVTWVMECVRSVSYSFMVNGHLSKALIPQTWYSSGRSFIPVFVSSLCRGAWYSY